MKTSSPVNVPAWRNRADIPNQKGFALTVKTVSGFQGPATVEKGQVLQGSERNALHFLVWKDTCQAIPISCVLGWLPAR